MGRFRDLLKSNGDPRPRARRDLAIFREASFSRADVFTPAPDDMYRRYAYLEYFLGAARYAAKQHHLDEVGFIEVGQEQLREVGATHGEVESLLSDFEYARFKPRGREAFQEGAKTMELWELGKDINAPMRLVEILRHQ